MGRRCLRAEGTALSGIGAGPSIAAARSRPFGSAAPQRPRLRYKRPG
ncbi:protein of unassigned function [Methylobacterium oryzae CBMB20]|uniref:Protein of unassigned function n=1 Tax=Methylobacterium oryzae CBMB20 TaxID=693986 RepID=A0A089P0Z6_9HYPH|nr:protein of unassigned function [Methylobacterium oryzae CBMB20]